MTSLDAWEARQRQTLDQLAPLLPACPAWCVKAEDHLTVAGVDATDGTVTYEHHTHRRVAATEDESGEPFTWRIERFERLHVDGTVDVYPTVVVPTFHGEAGFSASQARQIAAALLNAADELERLTS